jgi:hypothetical protein
MRYLGITKICTAVMKLTYKKEGEKINNLALKYFQTFLQRQWEHFFERF